MGRMSKEQVRTKWRVRRIEVATTHLSKSFFSLVKDRALLTFIRTFRPRRKRVGSNKAVNRKSPPLTSTPAEPLMDHVCLPLLQDFLFQCWQTVFGKCAGRGKPTYGSGI